MKATFVLFFLLSFGLNPEKTITGKVFDNEKSPLTGASVYLKSDPSKGTVTDSDGKFTINAPLGSQIVVSAVGFDEKTFKVTNKNHYEIHLKTTKLEEMIVTKEDIVFTQESVESKKIRTRPHRSVAPSPRVYDTSSEYLRTDAPDQNTEEYGIIKENQFLEVKKTPLSTFSIDVDRAAYSNVRRFINNGQMPPKDAVRIEEMINYFAYEYPQPTGAHPFAVHTEVAACPWNTAHQLALVNLQAKKIPTDNLPPSNLVFLIDVSGSMSSANKLPLLKSAFKLLTQQLRAQDKVSIVVYAGAAGLVLPPTPGNNQQAIVEALERLNAGGSTAGGAGIELAYKVAKENFMEGGNNRVILATDGDFNVGASSDDDMIRLIEEKRKTGIFVTTLGFGMGNYKDAKMEKIADKGNGNYAYIDNIQEAKKVLINEFGGTMFTVAKDVKLQLEFNPTQVKAYRLIGYENRLLNKEDFNDDTKDAGELGAGHTVTALYELVPVGVEGDNTKPVGDLKYQKQVNTKASKSKELFHVKFRYKLPDATQSKLFEQAVSGKSVAIEKTSENLRWASAVAAFGMLLRDSPLKGEATYQQVIALAQSAKGKDLNGYRSEFIRLVNSVELMKGVAENKK
ncbi:MAG: von Willebrand factor type A domain-containing protein [Thermonemataceae bacterium]